VDGYNFDNNWLNTGSGVQKGLISEWKEARLLPETWSQALGEDFLTDFLEWVSWKLYACPLCSGKV